MKFEKIKEKSHTTRSSFSYSFSSSLHLFYFFLPFINCLHLQTKVGVILSFEVKKFNVELHFSYQL